MAPRPEKYDKVQYATSSDDDCAMLVKPGQLNTFNRNRNEQIKRRLMMLEEMAKNLEVADNQNQQPEQQRGRSLQRLTDHQSDESYIKLGNRVLVKEKYEGTCRYIGPIQETYISPEIFIGIELDEKLTQNSGIFGSKKYFDCEFGYGLMVPAEKVRNLTTTQNFTKTMSLNRTKSSTMQNQASTYGLSEDEDARSESNGTLKSKIKRSKSVADLSRLVKTTNWMEAGTTKRKVSPGFTSLTRSKSSSNLDRRNRHPINDADPRDILNQIKKFQPNFGDVPQYGGEHVRIGMGSMTGNSMGSMMGNMGYGNVPVTTSYGLPLQYPQAMQAANLMQGSGNSNDPLRNSFARIMSTRPSTPPQLSYSNAPLPLPFALSSKSATAGHFTRDSFYSQDTRSEASSHSFHSAQSAPEMFAQFPGHARSVVSYGAGKPGMTSSPQSHRGVSQDLGDLSRTTSMSSNMDQKPYLQAFQAMNQPLCATCAACTTCGPARYQSFAQQMQEKQQNELLHYKTKQEMMRKQYESQQEQLRNKHTMENMQQQQSMQAAMLKDIHNQRLSSLSSSSAVGEKSKSHSDISSIELDEYEKWKCRHGTQMGRQMKRGLAKLQSAVTN